MPKLAVAMFLVCWSFYSLTALSCTRIGQSYIHAIKERHAELVSDQCMYSDNGKYVAVIHHNGELALYRAEELETGPGIIARSGISSGGGRYVLSLQEDGLLVIYRNSIHEDNIFWTSRKGARIRERRILVESNR